MMNNTEELYSLVKFCRIRPYCMSCQKPSAQQSPEPIDLAPQLFNANIKIGEWEKFRRDIAAPLKRKHDSQNERGMATLQALLRAILLRRTKHSNIHGQPILQLPPKETREDRVPFDKDQSEFYFALERSAQVQLNRCELHPLVPSIISLPNKCAIIASLLKA